MSHYKIALECTSIQWTGDNYKEVCDLVGVEVERDASELFNGEPSNLLIPTSDGIREVRVFDLIIKDNFEHIYVVNNVRID